MEADPDQQQRADHTQKAGIDFSGAHEALDWIAQHETGR
jgi:hypothetical protein